MAADRRLLFIEALKRSANKPARRRRGSARCYGPPCQIPNCDGRTVGNKPYCLEHVVLMPYAAKIQDRESRREEEIKASLEDPERKEGVVVPPLDGFVAQDLLGAIKLNQSSIPALSRDLRVPHKVIELLVFKLVDAGVVAIRRSKRSIYVKLIVAPPQASPGSQVGLP